MSEQQQPTETPPARIASVVDEGQPFPPIRRVPLLQPMQWWLRGWLDFRAAPRASLFYGLSFAGMGWLLRLALKDAPQFLSVLTCGFLLLGPLLCLGLYDISRRLERGERDLRDTVFAIRGRWSNVGVLALVLGVIMLLWARASLVVIAISFTQGMPTSFLATAASLDNLEFLIIYSFVGFLFASLVFAISWVSIPLMLDRDTDAISAVIISVVSLFKNFRPALLWAIAIVALTVIGFYTYNIAHLLFIPVIGHGTWHAYRDVVGEA
ncbi:DUF2189 domain-containing protein [Massilia sp. TS11]|uniref:DUF2189 domain-containing protein n=1 Tax=Massilia sp. TS11 TaxID=2908003 RepID=UPI001EDA47A6|nr:DUF2189 domain-containing protein [Massilia sp. TS11]MCG2582997.1 DUF2189 domain-containing protein [Massilia sp. TS11]